MPTVHTDGITPEENKHIREVWEGMDGSATYNDALCRIAGVKDMSQDTPD